MIEGYEKPEDYLYSLKRKGVKLGLDKIRDFLSNFGDPQYDFDTALIAGTNGKGSVTTILSNILSEAGYRTGRYISPHLEYFEERIRIDGENISRDELWELISEVRPVLEKIDGESPEKRPSFFEVLTTLAFMYFSDKNIDMAVMEVGMGGRLDATNVSSRIASAVTMIGYDHSKYLGSSREKIAFEKAGIIKEGNYFVTSEKDEQLKKYFRGICRERGADFHHALAREYRISKKPLRLYLPEYGTMDVPGKTKWQAENALVAINLAEGLKEKGYELSKKDIVSGLRRTVLPGRMDVVSERPRIMMDSAHNITGMKALREGLEDVEHKRLLLVMGVLGDKDYKGIAEIIAPLCDRVYTAEPVSERKLDSDILAEEFEDSCPVESFSHGIEALKRAEDDWREGDLILVTGSTYLLGDIRRKM